MSLAPAKKKAPAKKSVKQRAIMMVVLGGLMLFLALILFVLPIFINPFSGSRGILPIVALTLALVGGGLAATFLILMKRVEVGTIVGAAALVLSVSAFIGWLRYNAYAWEAPQQFPNVEFSPLTVFSAKDLYAQTEYPLGVALTFALIVLGVLVSCIPIFRARDIPENIEKEKLEAARKQRQATPFRVRPMR